ncbi:DMT family transporter [Ahrensia marina]|uniref:Membrane protein n=1 Tax=Ahrensia marina TaxID=1514904 RepID=A0A0N0VLS4_9HYPH|nr:DMT family transporter [Ahrensia marina]KPB00944.1 membrane protein [Ahrensia marina]
MTLATNYKAAAFMALAMSGFIINDVIVKTLTDEINYGQVMFVRGLMMVVLLAALIAYKKHSITIKQIKSGPMLLRVSLEAVATTFFLIGFSNLPVANASAIMQALPLAVTLGAYLFLKEPVGWRRLSAILIGLVGVLIIIRPGLEGFNIYSLAILTVVILAAGRDIVTRLLDRDISPFYVSLLAAIAVTVLGAVLIVPFGGWRPMNLHIFGTLMLAAGFLFVGYHFIVLAMRDGDIATVAPFRYAALLWAVILGYLVFDDLPDLWTVIGSIIVVGSGLYAIFREHQRNKSIKVISKSASQIPGGRGT